MGNSAQLSTHHFPQLIAIGGLARSLRKLMQLGSYQQRVGGMRRLLKELNASNQLNDAVSIKSGDYIAFDHVRVVTPAGHQLVEDLTFAVRPGTNLLITGPNGAGKIFGGREIIFLPQLQSCRQIQYLPLFRCLMVCG